MDFVLHQKRAQKRGVVPRTNLRLGATPKGRSCFLSIGEACSAQLAEELGRDC